MAPVLKSSWLSWVIAAATAAFGLLNYDRLPDQMGVHFNIHGQPDSFMSKAWAVWFLPALSVVSALGIALLVRISPREYSLENSMRTVAKINVAVTALVCALQMGVIMTSLDPARYSISPFICVAFAAFMVGIGNSMSKLERNFYVGVRTPWTLASERNWLATHRFAARLMVGVGTLLLISNVFYSNAVLAFCALIGTLLVPVGYSYWFYARVEQKTAG